MEPSKPPRGMTGSPAHPAWPLGRAKARLSEVVRLARAGHPQRVTVHGRDAVVIVAGADFDRMAAREAAPTLHGLLSGSPLSRVPDASPPRARFRHGDE